MRERTTNESVREMRGVHAPDMCTATGSPAGKVTQENPGASLPSEALTMQPYLLL